MDTEKFKNLYNNLTNQIQQKNKNQQDEYLVQFNVQQTEFAFYKNQNNHYLCKFSFDFLQQPQRVEVELIGKDIQFKIDDTEDNEQTYSLKKFKQYFNPQFQLFKKAFTEFKEFLNNNNKIKEQQNVLSVIPLKTLMNNDKNKQISINIDNVIFLFNEIKNAYHDTYRVDFELAERDVTDEEKFVVVIFKTYNIDNYYILNIYLNTDNVNLDNAIILSKEQFTKNYPTYITKLNQAIATFIQMN